MRSNSPRQIIYGTIRPGPSGFERILCRIGLHRWEWLTATKKRCERCAAYHYLVDGRWSPNPPPKP